MLKPVALALVAALTVATARWAGAQSPPARNVPPAGRDAARVEADVRMMLAEEVRSFAGDSVLPAEAVGLFLVPQALLSSTAAGSVTTAVVGPPGTEGFDAPARTVLSLLATTTLPADLAAQIRENMRNAELEAGDVWRIDVALGYYGLRSEDWRPGVQSESASYCLIAAGVVRVSGLHGPIATTTIRRGVDASSDGMPRPECQALQDYAANGGMLLRQATREMSSVLAAWIVNRTLQER